MGLDKVARLVANICKSPPREQMLQIIQLSPCRLKCVMRDGERKRSACSPPPSSSPCSYYRLQDLVSWVELGATPSFLSLAAHKELQTPWNTVPQSRVRLWDGDSLGFPKKNPQKRSGKQAPTSSRKEGSQQMGTPCRRLPGR